MHERGVAPDEREYVIITKADWIDDFQPLADWKTRKGARAAIVDRDWIYSTYSAANEPAKIRAFVHDAYDTWGTVYFLLGGDTNTIPFHTKDINDEDVPNDTYYSDFDGDWTCEVNVGRASVRGTAAIGNFIDKVLTYEQSPPLGDYARTALFLGFDLYEEGSGEGENCKEHIRTTHIPADWTYRSEYDSEPGGHHDDVIAYLNQGNNLVNHIDHCGTDVMGVGCVNHDEYLFNTDMNHLTNGDRQSILYSIGCWPCDYPDYTCIAESFVQNVGGGGVAFIGNSRSGYYTAYGDDGFSLRYDRFFYRQLFMFDYYHLGECFSRHKDRAYQHDPIMMYVFTELTLLGDPELPIWTDDPQALTVSHASVFPFGTASFTVHVADDAGEDVEGAAVCLWKGDEVHLVAATDTAGDASFAPSPTTAGTMLVTITGRNDLPYLGSAEVGYVLDVDVVGSGWVERFPDKPAYAQDELVALIAHAEPGWTFAYWSGDLSGSANPAAITMSAHQTVTAHFLATPPTDCPEDLVVDGQIGLEDLSELLGAYGAQPGDSNWNPNADFDGDDVIDLSDLSQMLSVYGQDCPTR